MPAPVGSGSNGVLLIGEALGEHEELVGQPFKGKAGQQLDRMLHRRGLKRDDFLIDNILRCRPPANQLPSDAIVLKQVIESCSPYIGATARDPRVRVLAPMGATAARTVLGLGSEVGITNLRGYVAWSPFYNKWVVPTFHPAYLARGNQRLQGVFLHDIERAIRIASEGHIPHKTSFTLDPGVAGAAAWAAAYEAALALDPEGVWLSYDIETPTKATGADEGTLEFDDPTYLILRVGFAHREGEALSVPWTTEYLPVIRRLLESPGIKVGWNCSGYDNPRLAANNMAPKGPCWDMMWAWHILNSGLEKGLAFVASFYLPDQPRWKHLAASEPAFYNATDAEVALRIAHGVVKDLHLHRQWRVFERHVVMLEAPLRSMVEQGLPLDQEARRAFSDELASQLASSAASMQRCVPAGARSAKPYKRDPGAAGRLKWELKERGTEWITKAAFTSEKQCPGCGALKPPKSHFKAFKKKQNACAGLTAVEVMIEGVQWIRLEPFQPSNKRMAAYAKSQRHRPVLSKDADRRETYDEEALKTLCQRYPKDPLYPLVVSYREVEKLLGTYVGRWLDGRWQGGMPVGSDGRVHTTYSHNPSTLRLSSQSPNLTTIPRGNDKSKPYQEKVKQLFCTEPDSILLECDFKAIEAVLTGYAAASPQTIRLAKLGIHDYVTSHVLAKSGLLAQPASLGLSDADLLELFNDLKKRFPAQRDLAKRVVYLSLYGGTPAKIYSTYPEDFRSQAEAAHLQQIIWEALPDIRRWQHQVVALAEKQGFLRNPFDYVGRFWQVLQWEKDLWTGEWSPSWGEDAKAAIAFGPQSTAAGILKEAVLRLWYERGVGRYLRLLVHDSILAMIPKREYDRVAPVIWTTMAEPVKELPLPPEWNLGAYLSIDVEAKASTSNWGAVEKVRIAA